MPRTKTATPAADQCKWFLLCTNPATTSLSHPILGGVPTCQSCADKYARLAPREEN